MSRRPVARMVACLALLAARAVLAGDDPPARVEVSRGLPPALGEDVESRLRALEMMNRRLLDQQLELLRRGDEERRVSDERYRDLERRYEELRGRLGGGESAAVPEARPEARPAMPPGWAESVRAERVEEAPEGPAAATAVHRPRWSPGLKARFDDGVMFATPEEEFTLRLHVLNQVDFKALMPNDQFPARSGLYIPRVRVYFEGRATRPFEYEVSLQRSVEGVWDLLDANLDYRPTEAFGVRFGRMLVPYSYDWYDHLEQYFITPERGLFPLNFGISRSAGLLAHGELFENRLEYAIGGFDGRFTGLADNNDIRDAVGYVNAKPFLRSERYARLRNLNVGASIFGGRQIVPQAPLPLRTSLQSSENDEAARAASPVFLNWDEGVAAFGDRSAVATHLAYYGGGFSLEAEWQSGLYGFARREPAAATRVPVSGYHVTLAYFLTGEEIERRDTVVPLRPYYLGPGRRGPGAIELFARYSQLHLGREVFDAELSDPLQSTREVFMTDLGFNWYPNRFVKFYVDWQLPFYGSPVLVNPGTQTYSNSGSLFWVRCQLWY